MRWCAILILLGQSSSARVRIKRAKVQQHPIDQFATIESLTATSDELVTAAQSVTGMHERFIIFHDAVEENSQASMVASEILESIGGQFASIHSMIEANGLESLLDNHTTWDDLSSVQNVTACLHIMEDILQSSQDFIRFADLTGSLSEGMTRAANLASHTSDLREVFGSHANVNATGQFVFRISNLQASLTAEVRKIEGADVVLNPLFRDWDELTYVRKAWRWNRRREEIRRGLLVLSESWIDVNLLYSAIAQPLVTEIQEQASALAAVTTTTTTTIETITRRNPAFPPRTTRKP